MLKYQKTDLNTLYHFGVPGMQWGVRKVYKTLGAATRLTAKGVATIGKGLDKAALKVADKWWERDINQENPNSLITKTLGNITIGMSFIAKQSLKASWNLSMKALELGGERIRTKVSRYDTTDFTRRKESGVRRNYETD